MNHTDEDPFRLLKHAPEASMGKDSGSRLNPKLYRRTFLARRYYEEASDSGRELEIRRHWNEFLDQDPPQLVDVLKEERWIWERVEESDAD